VVPVKANAEHDAPSPVRRILRELPRKRIALVLLVVVVNLDVVTYRRGRAVAELRRDAAQRHYFGPGDAEVKAWWEVEARTCVPPWTWTTDEWRNTVWPWK
jgi:hypothetical protein